MGYSTDHDEKIGRALAGADREATPQSCPELEDLAALCEGMLPAAERDRLMAHVADCEHCRQVFLLSRELVQEQTRPRRRVWLWIPAVACAALLLLVLRVTERPVATPQAPLAKIEAVPRPAPPQAPTAVAIAPAAQTPPRAAGPPYLAAELAQALAGADGWRAAGSDQAQHSASYGYAEAPAGESLVFVLGRQLLHFELAVAANDRVAALRSIAEGQAQLVQDKRLRAAEVAAGALYRRCQEPAPLSACRGQGETVANALPAPFKEALALGTWVESARLALAGGEGYFPIAALRRLRKEFPTADAETGRLLEEIETLAEKPQQLAANRDLLRQKLESLEQKVTVP